MATKTTTRIKKKIIERLVRGDDPDKIALDLCEELNINWTEAEALVNDVHSGNRNEITLTQSPLLVSIALITFIGGVALTGFTAYDLVTAYDNFNAASAHGNGLHIGYLFFVFASGGWFWERILLGLLMIVGSLRGMHDVWTAIFARLGIFQE